MYKVAQLLRCSQVLQRLQQRKYYQKNAAKLTATNSARYRKQALSGPEILDGLVFPIPILPAVIKGKLKAEKEADKKAKVDTKLQAKKCLRNSRISHSLSKRGPRDPRRRNNLGFDNSYWDMKSCSIS